MPTVYVSYQPTGNGKPPANLIPGQIGKETVSLIPVEIGSEKLNCIQAAKKAGVLIPHYCWHPALSVVASCRMCLVEVGERKPDGAIAMQPRVVPGCQTPVKDGAVIVTHNAKVDKAQADTLEGLLLNHPLDCPVCDKAGECLLQDYTFEHGRATTRMIDEKNTPPNKPYIGDNVTLFTDRCIMCSRCVRFTREIAGTAELQIVNRGNHAEIDIFPGEPLNNKLATNVVDLCPVGALCSKDFLYKHRVWNLKSKPSVCPDCSTGCSIHVDANKSIVYRLRPRENPQAQGFFMCDDGRLGYHYINSKDRFLRPMQRKDGQLQPIGYTEAVSAVRTAIKDAVQKNAFGVVAVLSPFLTCEEAYLLAKYLKGMTKAVQLALGPVPVVGEDDTYPKDRRGKPLPTVKFTIRAEKCPNRKGVEKVLEHYQGRVIAFDEVLRQADDGKLSLVYLAAGYPPRGDGWITPAQADSLKKVPTVILQDLLPTPASDVAHFVIPAAAFAEKSGTFVNHAGLAQAFPWSVTPSGECRTDGQVFLDLMERKGLLHAGTLRKEMAAEVRGFAPLAAGEPGEYGILLDPAR
ncbi:MAG: molybdopterin-dependent oxidoreductase [Gemmataceae bacterium]